MDTNNTDCVTIKKSLDDNEVFDLFTDIVDDFKDDEACNKLSKIFYQYGYKITVTVECDEESDVKIETKQKGREF